MLVSPQLLARCVTTWCVTERRSSPATLAAGNIGHKTAVQMRSYVVPEVGQRPIRLPTCDDTLVLVRAFAGIATSVEEHPIRILRFS